MGALIGLDCFLFAISSRYKAVLVCHWIAAQALVEHWCCSVFLGLALVNE